MKFLFLEPFFGGSHRDFAEALVNHSRHQIDLLTLPARFWKWRMRGAALYFAKKIPSLEGYSGLISTDLMSLSDFKALCAPSCPPSLVYFHENQLSYPLAPGESMDFQFGFTDITTALTADRVLFNSRTHFNAFFSRLPDFLKMMPEYRPKWVVDEIRSKAGVLYPGCPFPAEKKTMSPPPDLTSPPLIIWNHRWEFDKNPRDFFDALDAVSGQGLDFRLALMGENFQAVPKGFIAARQRYGPRIVQYGYVEAKEEYRNWLRKGSIVISTARQENFGIAIVEAIRFGCIPLLPHRLSYPEIVPAAFHSDFLYKDRGELVEKLAHLLSHVDRFREKGKTLSKEMSRYAWENVIDQYDEELDKLHRFS
jgi:glycosyltransferase involved in cell wall biosynthesis